MAFVTQEEISSRWQIICKETETELPLNLECKEPCPSIPHCFENVPGVVKAAPALAAAPPEPPLPAGMAPVLDPRHGVSLRSVQFLFSAAVAALVTQQLINLPAQSAFVCSPYLPS